MSLKSAIVIRAIATVIATAGAWRYCIVPFQCNRTIVDARLLAERAARDADPTAARADAQRSMEILAPFLRTCAKTSVDIHMILAADARTLGRDEEAVAHYDAALSVQPRPEIYFERGMTRIAQRRVSEGEANLTEAARFNRFFLDEMTDEMRNRIGAAVARSR